MSAGPFIVTHEAAGACEHCGGPSGVRHCRACDGPLYREAFATLEEARDSVGDRIRERATDETSWQVFWDVAPSSGTVGPLPDGSVIEVEVKDDLWRDAPSPSGPWDTVEEQCAAWNAGHGIGQETQA